MTDPPLSPPERSPWAEFAFAALANAAGTVLAVVVLYLAGVAAGIVRTNARILITILITVGVVTLTIRAALAWLVRFWPIRPE